MLHSAPETSFFSRIIPRLGVDFGDPEMQVDEKCAGLARDDFQLMTGMDLPDDFVAVTSGTNARDLFERMLGCFNRDAKPMWVEKTTLHARHLMAIRRFYPEMKVINVIRDPVACVGSMSAIKPTSFDDLRIGYLSSLYGFSRLWNECIAAAFAFPYQDQVLHIRYESLVGDPEKTMRSVCGFLGIGYEQHMLETFHDSARDVLSSSSCPWQSGNLSAGIREEPVNRWRRRLGPAKIWLVQKYTLAWSQQLGYYEEIMKGSRIVFLLLLVSDQFVRLLSATRIEISFRKLVARIMA
jgi:hypothetical protein